MSQTGIQAAPPPRPPTSPLPERIRRGVICEGELMDGPFGPRRVTCADYTASGRSLDFIEDFSREGPFPVHGRDQSLWGDLYPRGDIRIARGFGPGQQPWRIRRERNVAQ